MRRNALIAIGIGLLGSLLFLGAVGHGFAMDDPGLIKNNPLSRGIDQLPEIFRTDYWYPTMESGLYRPLAKASYVFNWELGGLDPRGYHLTNVVLHGVMCAVVFFFLLAVTRDRALSILASLLFAVHAVHTEVVASITFGRPELLAGVLSLLAATAYIGTRDVAPRRERIWRLAASAVALFLAMLCKESAVTILGVIGVYDVCYRTPADQPLWRRTWQALRERFPIYLTYVVLMGAYLAFRFVALAGQKATPPHITIDNPIVGVEQPWRLLNALFVTLHYLWLLVFPLHLSYDYSYAAIPLITDAADPRLWLTVACVVAATAGTVWAYRRQRTAFFGIAFFLLTFSVVSNVFVLIGTILGERLLYLPSVGFCLVAALALRAAARTLGGARAGVVLAGMATVVLGLHGWRAIVRTPDWKSEYTLFTHDVKVVPGSTKAQNNAGAILIKHKKYEEGLALLRRAIEIAPLGYHVPYYTAGITLSTLGRDEEAIPMYEGSLLNGDPDPITRNNLGYILVDREIDVERGIALIEEAVRMMPDYPEFRDSLAWGYFKRGDLEKAREEMLKAIEMTEARGRSVTGRREKLAEIENAIRLREFATRESP